MANEDRPRGFVPVGHYSGGQIRPRMYRVADGTSIYKGDVVSLDDTSAAKIATAGEICIGVAAETVLSPSSEDILVWDDPNIIYEVQGYTGVTFASADSAGCIGDHVANAADTTYNVSRQELNTITPIEAGTIGATFYCLGKVDRPGNAWGEHVKLLVKFYEHNSIHTASA